MKTKCHVCGHPSETSCDRCLEPICDSCNTFANGLRCWDRIPDRDQPQEN